MPAHRWAPLYAVRRAPVAVAAALLLAAVLVSPASAAVVPAASQGCHGTLSKAPTADEPNNLAYKFTCSNANANPITAYTLAVNRTLSDFTAVDNFSTTADVVDATGGIAGGAEGFNCEGSIPGSGVNCNGSAQSGHFTQGTVDLADPYCPSIPAGSKPGTNPLPQAMVQLIVTDTSGAQSGPFRLNLDQVCPVVKPVPKPTPKPKHPVKKKGKGKGKGHK